MNKAILITEAKEETLAKEVEICQLIVDNRGCPLTTILKGKVQFCCNVCPFSRCKHDGLKCVNYVGQDNHEEVVKQAQEFIDCMKGE